MPSVRALFVSTVASILVGSGPVDIRSNQQIFDIARLPGFMCGQPRGAGGLMPAALQSALAGGQALASVATGPVPLVAGLDKLAVAISSSDDTAKRYFNQGLALTYGFNHDGAIRSFRAAQARDPQCAMCFWGEAYAYGPNINAPMDPAANRRTLAALDQAMALRDRATPWERALIEALAQRYSSDPAVDRVALDADYAVAMKRVAATYPENDDIAALAAEAIMSTRPWDYWEADGRTPKGDIGAAITMIEGALARNPDHPQAIHLYIHLLEASDPKRA